MAICGLVFTSCELKQAIQDGEFEVSLTTPSVESGRGQQFVRVKCSTEWTLEIVSESGEEIDWADLSVRSGVGNKSNIILSYQVNESPDVRKLKVVLDNGTNSVFCTMRQYPAGDRPEEDDPEQEQMPDQNHQIDLTKTGWLELPALDDPNLRYYSHSFQMGGKTYRNYSFGWSQKDYTALWVAYPLSRTYTNGSVGRSEDWNFDPLLGDLWSPAPFDGYAGSYDRGHQIPSADRQCCYEANAQTYYGTNIVPQSNVHNTGIWVKLENKVRGIANNSDTTYVVTGVMIADSKEYTTDSTKDKNGVYRQKSELKTLPVPTHFFKAVLRYSKSSTLGQWNAAAFYYEHKPYSGDVTKDHSMSIDELEEMTGIDFFVNLPAKVGEAQAARIEAADPAGSPVWW